MYVSVNFVSTHVFKIACEPERVERHEQTEELLHRLWDLNSRGIRREKNAVKESFLEDISFSSGRYSVKCPMEEMPEQNLLPDNYDLIFAMLNSLLRRLRKEPSILKEYDQIIQDQLSNGIKERVDEREDQ